MNLQQKIKNILCNHSTFLRRNSSFTSEPVVSNLQIMHLKTKYTFNSHAKYLRENSFSHMSFINAIVDSTKDFINAPDEMQTQTLTPLRIVNYHIKQVYVFYM